MSAWLLKGWTKGFLDKKLSTTVQIEARKTMSVVKSKKGRQKAKKHEKKTDGQRISFLKNQLSFREEPENKRKRGHKKPEKGEKGEKE